MNSRPEITAMLSLSIKRHICPDNDPRIYWAREVTFDYATMNAVRVDFMKFKPVFQWKCTRAIQSRSSRTISAKELCIICNPLKIWRM